MEDPPRPGDIAGLFERVFDAWLSLDRDGRITAANPAALAFFDLPPEALIGQSIWELPPTGPDTLFQPEFLRALSEGQPVHYESPTRLADRWAEILAVPDGDGLVLHFRDISLRKFNELALTEGHLQLRAALNSITEAYLRLDDRWQVLDCNRVAAADLFGRPPEELPGRGLWDLRPDLLGSETFRQAHRAAATGLPLRFEDRWGETWYEVLAYPRDRGVDLYLHNIDERKRSEHNTRFLAALGEALMAAGGADAAAGETARRLGIHLGLNRCLVAAVDEAADLLRVFPDFHQDCPSFSGPRLLSGLPESVLERLRAGQVVVSADLSEDLPEPVYENLCVPLRASSAVLVPRHAGGRWQGLLLAADGQPREWRAGELALLGAAADLAWLAVNNGLLLQDLRETRARFELVIARSHISMLTTDRDLRITWVYNPLVGGSPGQHLGRRLEEIFQPEEALSVQRMAQTVLNGGRGQRRELSLLIGGAERVLDIAIEPLLEDRQVNGLTITAVDVTDLRRMEAEIMAKADSLEVQRQILQHIEEERLQIARDLHDGPLQSLIAVNYGLADALASDDRQERAAKMARLQDSLQAHIQELRAFCADLRPPTLAPFGLEKAIRSHADQFRARYPNLRLELDLMEDRTLLPESLRLALFRVCQELLSNAARHAQASTVTVRLWLDAEEVNLVVEDDGIGFTPPGQWRELARSGHFGLVGVHERVAAVGGQLRLDSRAGRGTVAQVTIPRPPEE